MIVGKVKNISEEEVSEVSIEFEIFDKNGESMGTRSFTAGSLKAGDEAQINLEIYPDGDKIAEDIKVRNINALYKSDYELDPLYEE